ncbi:MAG: TatD family hydrolase [Candidatus Saccharimonadales bacterium]
MLIDTHCHIHDYEFFTDDLAEDVYRRARQQAISMLCVGTTQPDSRRAVEFVAQRDGVWAVVGVHPHEAKDGVGDIGLLLSEQPQNVVGIGEIGLDYYYNHSSRDAQVVVLEQQLQWARDYNLPVSFHVREAYDDFWPIFDNFSGIRGVLHSFTDLPVHMEKALERGLYIGVNGISTFARDKQDMFASLPLAHMLLETDAPFLTPIPKRGTMNEPVFVTYVAKHHAALREISVEELASVTTANARALFAL